jgi:hypothetical protein
MHRKFVPIAAVVFTLVGLTRMASADVLFSTRGTGIDDLQNFSSTGDMHTAVLEDAVLAGGSGPFNLTGINIGYYNASNTSTTFDVSVSFWDNVDYTTNAPGTIMTGQIGTTKTFAGLVAPAGGAPGNFLTFGETGLLSIPGGINVPDNTVGIIVTFLNPGTQVISQVVEPMFHGPLIDVGSSDHRFGEDNLDSNGFMIGLEPPFQIESGDTLGGDVNSWGTGLFYANMYLELQGVPEPASLSLLALGGLVGLRRRRA